jgi:hypothetical protein
MTPRPAGLFPSIIFITASRTFPSIKKSMWAKAGQGGPRRAKAGESGPERADSAHFATARPLEPTSQPGFARIRRWGGQSLARRQRLGFRTSVSIGVHPWLLVSASSYWFQAPLDSVPCSKSFSHLCFIRVSSVAKLILVCQHPALGVSTVYAFCPMTGTGGGGATLNAVAQLPRPEMQSLRIAFCA